MADLSQAEELVRAMEQNPAFREEVEAAPTMTAKQAVVKAHGHEVVALADMKAYVERQGGTLTLKEGDRELSEQELAAVAGGLTDEQTPYVAVFTGAVAAGVTLTAAVAAN